MISISDRRKDPRFLVDDNFQVKVLFSSDNPKALGRSFDCSTIDVSKSGLQINSHEPFIVNSVLDLSVSVKDSEKEFLLTGNVQWCKPSNGGIAHRVGIKLKARAGNPTDLDRWKQLIKHLK